MTIQTDYEDIEKGCRRTLLPNSIGNCGEWENLSKSYQHQHMEWCKVCLAKRQTFIEENLKRINEMIEFLEGLWIREEVILKLKQLKADKQFLEEKR